MNKTETEKLVSEAFGATETAMSTAIRETVEYLDGRGLLNTSAVKVTVDEIKDGDWIAYFFESGNPGEFYRATGDCDSNYNGRCGEFFRLDSSVFGKSKPEVKVEDLEPGTRFRASLLGKPVAEYVRGKGEQVFQLTDVSFCYSWSAVNKDFTDIEIID